MFEEKVIAIYKGDIAYDKMMVFELDKNGRYFVSRFDKDIYYSCDLIFFDEDWIVIRYEHEDDNNVMYANEIKEVIRGF